MSTIPDVPTPVLSPEEFAQRVRDLSALVPHFIVMSGPAAQTLSASATVSDVVMHAAINALAASPDLRNALGRDAETLRHEVELAARWSEVIDELDKMRRGPARLPDRPAVRPLRREGGAPAPHRRDEARDEAEQAPPHPRGTRRQGGQGCRESEQGSEREEVSFTDRRRASAGGLSQ